MLKIKTPIGPQAKTITYLHFRLRLSIILIWVRRNATVRLNNLPVISQARGNKFKPFLADETQAKIITHYVTRTRLSFSFLKAKQMSVGGTICIILQSRLFSVFLKFSLYNFYSVVLTLKRNFEIAFYGLVSVLLL